MIAPQPLRLAGQRVWVMAKGFAPDEGGQQTYAEQVALAYARLGARVTVITQTRIGPRRGEHRGLELIDLGPGKGVATPLRWLRALRALRREQGAPALCHGTTWRTSVPPLLAGLDFATTFHGREFMAARGPVAALLGAVIRRGSPLVAVSRYTAKRLRPRVEQAGGDLRRIVTAWNGCATVPLPRPPRPAQSLLRIMTLCRLEPRKNLVAALDAVRLAGARGIAIDYVICGRGPDARALAPAAQDMPPCVRVRLAGLVPEEEAMQLHASSDVFLHPQIALDDGRDYEGFGIAVADAMRAGCVAIVGNAGGAAELVEHGRSGFIVEGRDIQAIAATLEALAQGPQRLAAMASASAERARRFDWDAHVAALLNARERER